MADRDYAQFLEVLRGQFQQDRFSDLIFSEGLLIAFQAETAQPRRDVHMAPTLRLRRPVEPAWFIRSASSRFALDVVAPEVAQLEQIPQLTVGRRGNNNGSRLRQGLTPSRKVRGVADHSMFLGGPALAGEVADDYETRRDTDADFE